jgi:hypothetical protein
MILTAAAIVIFVIPELKPIKLRQSEENSEQGLVSPAAK